jgi:hypothetical protein
VPWWGGRPEPGTEASLQGGRALHAMVQCSMAEPSMQRCNAALPQIARHGSAMQSGGGGCNAAIVQRSLAMGEDKEHRLPGCVCPTVQCNPSGGRANGEGPVCVPYRAMQSIPGEPGTVNRSGGVPALRIPSGSPVGPAQRGGGVDVAGWPARLLAGVSQGVGGSYHGHPHGYRGRRFGQVAGSRDVMMVAALVSAVWWTWARPIRRVVIPVHPFGVGR